MVILLDGDDKLYDEHVFTKINQAYLDKSIWLVYSNYEYMSDGRPGHNNYIPELIQSNNYFRYYKWVSSHLKTFYSWLFKKIKKEDLLYEEEFFQATSDRAIMYPMLEMASKGHIKYIPEIWYVYRDNTGFNDNKTNRYLQLHIKDILIKKEPYTPL